MSNATLEEDRIMREDAPSRPSGPSRIVTIAEHYALLWLLLALVFFFSVLPASSETFPTLPNLAFLTGNQAITTLLAVALVVPLVAGHFDFSVGSVATSCSVLVASLMAELGLGVPLSAVIGVAYGAGIGAINGLLVARVGMNSFVSTLGMATLLGGLIQLRTGGRPIISGIAPGLVSFGSATWFGIPRIIYVVLIAVLLVWYLLTHTPYGRALYAIGSNEGAARLVGLPIRRHTHTAFIVSGALAGLGGVLLTARTGGATPDPGLNLIFPALAAVFLGATAVQPGRFNVWGTVIGVAFVSVSVSGLTLAGADAWVNPVFNGTALLIAVAISTVLARRRLSG